MTTPRPTLAQVARRAGVSVSSVSRALNGQSASRRTIESVRAAVNELGYVPDATARLLKLGHQPAIACAVPDVANPVYIAMVNAMEAVARQENYRLSLVSIGSDPWEITELVRNLDRGFADGLIITPLRVTDELATTLSNAAVPSVVIGAVDPDVRVDSVGADSAAGVRLALDHLVAQGHRRIALLNGPADTTPGGRRQQAYLEYCAAHALETTVITADDFTTEASLAASRQFLIGEGWPTAILAANDLLALGVLKAAPEFGLVVGKDLALVGMDDTMLADLVHPTLTSVSLGAERRAQLAIDLLIRRISRPGGPPMRLKVEPSLTLRASSTYYQEVTR